MLRAFPESRRRHGSNAARQGLGRPHRSGTAERAVPLFIGLHLVHEVTSPQAFQMLAERGLSVRYRDRTFATVDHIIPTDGSTRPYVDGMAEQMFVAIEQNIERTGIPFFDRSTGRQGIVHVIGPELGLTQPGMTIACGDSHTSTHGAFGAIAFGIGTSQVRDVLATQTISRGQATVPAHRRQREARRWRVRQGRDSGHHRPPGSAGRGRLCLRVRRRCLRRHVHGRTHDRLQHVD